jgi:hypothetical protein
MQENFVPQSRVVVLVPFRPIIGCGVSENGSRAIECRSRNGVADIVKLLQALFGVFVPEVEGSVSAGCGEGPVGWVERDGVDCVDGFVVTVAFEGEV